MSGRRENAGTTDLTLQSRGLWRHPSGMALPDDERAAFRDLRDARLRCGGLRTVHAATVFALPPVLPSAPLWMTTAETMPE